MNDILDGIWNRVVGGMDWLKQVIFGEFQDNRDLSAVIADMLVSFVPGVIIVTSARDLTAIVLRLVKYPEKREETEEWMLLIACTIPLVLPILAAAVGAAAAGVGAIVGGIAGSEAGAVLRAVCLLLIRKGAHVLVEVVGFLRKFVKGDIMLVLRDIKFAKYGKAIVDYVGKFIGKVRNIIKQLIAELNKVPLVHDWLVPTIKKLEQLERDFYGVQSSAMKAVPKALAELDARLQHILNEALPRERQLAHAGVPASAATPIKSEKVRVASQSTNPLGTPPGTKPAPTRAKTPKKTNLHPEEPKLPKVKKMKQKKVPCFKTDRLPASKFIGMDAQLAAQQKGLNKMTVQEYIDGRKLFEDKVIKRDPAVAKLARAGYEKTLTERFKSEFIDQGFSPVKAVEMAKNQAASEMKTLAALHNPDMVSAGQDVITGFGDRNTNSTIGSQWKRSVPDGKTKIQLMDEAANAVPAAQRGTTQINMKLERCK